MTGTDVVREGPLSGITVLEIAAVGPVPFGVMLLADLGADVVRVDRVSSVHTPGLEGMQSGVGRRRRSVALDLKDPRGSRIVRELATEADVLVEGFRPGVAERLGIGPRECRAGNPGLVYARMSGWGQSGPFAPRAGHDINYAALSGALHPVGEPDRPPVPPLNYLADYGGGATYLAFGVVAALFDRERTGRGTVLDVAMVDGAASLSTLFHALLSAGTWSERRGANLLDGAAPFYRCYATADEGYMAVGAIEPQFYARFLEALGLDPADWPQHDRAGWPRLATTLTDIFVTRTRAEWSAVFAPLDACVTPVLRLSEAPHHPHNAERGTFVEDAQAGFMPGPAPRFEGVDRPPSGAPTAFGGQTDEILRGLGYDAAARDQLRGDAVIA